MLRFYHKKKLFFKRSSKHVSMKVFNLYKGNTLISIVMRYRIHNYIANLQGV